MSSFYDFFFQLLSTLFAYGPRSTPLRADPIYDICSPFSHPFYVAPYRCFYWLPVCTDLQPLSTVPYYNMHLYCRLFTSPIYSPTMYSPFGYGPNGYGPLGYSPHYHPLILVPVHCIDLLWFRGFCVYDPSRMTLTTIRYRGIVSYFYVESYCTFYVYTPYE